MAASLSNLISIIIFNQLDHISNLHDLTTVPLDDEDAKTRVPAGTLVV